jgi:hypothetical protein
MSISIDIDPVPPSGHAAALRPAISWSAIWSGAAVAVAASVLLTLAGMGLGFAVSYSPLGSRESLTGFTPAVGAGAIVIQVLSSALGGYLAGRLRTIWHAVHDDEAHFRDMAHGLVTWAVATVTILILAAAVLGPYAESLSLQATVTPPAPPTPQDAQRAANIAAQSALFMAVGMLLSAFVAAVAGRIGGMRNEQMHLAGSRG